MKQLYIATCCFVLLLNFFVFTTMGQEENVMIYGEIGHPRTLDPIIIENTIILRLSELIFDELVGYNKAGEEELQLADSYEISEDGLTYTFHIRPQIPWHRGGRMLTAYDVASTYELIKKTASFKITEQSLENLKSERVTDDVLKKLENIKNQEVTGEENFVDLLNKTIGEEQTGKFKSLILKHAEKTPCPLQSSLDFIESVSASDETTVVIRLKYPVISPLGRMAFKVLPQELNNNPKGLDIAFRTNPNGTGPFKVDEFSDTRVQLSQHSTSPIHHPRIERIIQRSFDDASLAVFALLQRQIDLLPEVPIEKTILNILSASSFYLVLQPYNVLSYDCIGFNMRNPILANKRVRQALTYALDKEGILKALYPPDYGEIISGPFPPNSPAYDKSIEPTPFDPEKAKRLLDEAGFTGKDKDGYRLNSEGQRLEFKFKAPTPTSGSQGVTTKSLYLGYVDAMKEIGVKINLEFRPWAAWHDEVFNKHDFDLTSIKWNFSNTDITTLFQSKFKEQKGGNNIVGYADPTVDSLLEQSKKAKTPEEFKDICHRLHRIIHDDCPYTFLWSVVKYASYNVRLHKVTIKPFSFFEFIDEWYIEGER